MLCYSLRGGLPAVLLLAGLLCAALLYLLMYAVPVLRHPANLLGAPPCHALTGAVPAYPAGLLCATDCYMLMGAVPALLRPAASLCAMPCYALLCTAAALMLPTGLLCATLCYMRLCVCAAVLLNLAGWLYATPR